MATRDVRPHYMTDGLKSMIVKGIKIGSIFRVHPYYWSDAEQRLKIRKGRLDLFLHKCALAYITVELCFMATRTAQAIIHQSISLETQIICAFYAIFHLYAVILAYGIVLAREDIPDMLNSGLVLLKSFDDRLPPAHHHPKIGIPVVWLIEQAQKAFFYPVHLCTLATVLICLLRPDYPVCFQIVYIPTCVILINIGTGVGIPLIPAITALGLKRMNTKEEIKKNLRDYTKIRLVLDQTERAYLRFLVPASQYILIALSTFGILGLIQLEGSERGIMVVVGIMGYGALMTIFNGLSGLNSEGQKVLRRWRQNYQIDQRNIRCLKPIRMNLSFYAYIDKGILLTSTDIIINNAITILLI